jgi:leader peptidase (prepilin peptidase)/N-methyltransferase
VNWSDAVSLWIILAGPAAGSFFTALADRHCRGLPLLYRRSHCTACAHVLRPTDLVPLWSYARLRGRCRYCQTRIPVSVWGGEWAGLALAFLAVSASSDPQEQLLGAFYLWLLLGLFQSDAACFRLPDALTLLLLIAGLSLGSIRFGFAQAALASVAGFAVFWTLAWGYRNLRKREGLGLGDVKMLAGLSSASGLAGLPWITLLAALSALIGAGISRLRGADVHATTRIAFGCHLAIAGGLVWYSGVAFG